MAAAKVFEINSDDKLQRYIEMARGLIKACQDIAHIDGSMKLLRYVQAELRFLQKLQCKTTNEQLSHLKSSNLTHFAAILHAALTFPTVTSILKPFDTPFGESVTVDVVGVQGHLWVKVIARKGQAIHAVCSGNGQYGRRSILTQATQFQQCADQNQIMYRNPGVYFCFYNGVTASVAAELQSAGVRVMGEIVSVHDDPVNAMISDGARVLSEDENELRRKCSDEDESKPALISEGYPHLNDHVRCSTDSANAVNVYDTETINASTEKLDEIFAQLFGTSKMIKPLRDVAGMHKLIRDLHSENVTCNKRINLDITALFALVSALTHGRCNYAFPTEILSLQAEEERRDPALPKIDSFLKGKDLFTCQTAWADFSKIVNTLGGESEKERTHELKKRVTIVEDEMSSRVRNLPLSAKIKDRAKVIFGTGDYHKMVTLTANSGFFRAASQHGVHLAVHVHQARALTQQKEILTEQC